MKDPLLACKESETKIRTPNLYQIEKKENS